MRRVLAILTINPDFVEFALPELKSILTRLPIPLQNMLDQQLSEKYDHPYEITHNKIKNFPFITLSIPNFAVHRKFFQSACKKSVMISKFVLLIGQGVNHQEMIKNCNQQVLQQECRKEDELVVCQFLSRNRVTAREDQLAKIHNVLAKTDVRGKVSFKNPQKRYVLAEQHQWYQGHHKSQKEATLKKVYFGIELCTNKIGTAKFNSQFELPKRIYLGPTSTDNDLAFMMCNQGKIEAGSLVYDPFVGTAGLLIPPATLGAITFGSDLDIRVLNGYSVGRINKRSPFYHQEKKFQLFTPKIQLNFQQYGLLTPNIIRVDSTKQAFRNLQLFDAIITDPPYGIRAMSRTVTTKEESQKKKEARSSSSSVKSNSDDEEPEQTTKGQKHIFTEQQKQRRRMRRQIQRQNRKKRKEELPEEEKLYKRSIVQKLNRQRIDQWDKFDKNKIQSTERERIFQGLLDLAKRHLRVGGRLVFLYPIFEDETFVGEKNLPPYQGFQLIDMSQNKMSKNNSRILVTMQKK